MDSYIIEEEEEKCHTTTSKEKYCTWVGWHDINCWTLWDEDGFMAVLCQFNPFLLLQLHSFCNSINICCISFCSLFTQFTPQFAKNDPLVLWMWWGWGWCDVSTCPPHFCTKRGGGYHKSESCLMMLIVDMMRWHDMANCKSQDGFYYLHLCTTG